jgi:hypothetical protein
VNNLGFREPVWDLVVIGWACISDESMGAVVSEDGMGWEGEEWG